VIAGYYNGKKRNKGSQMGHIKKIYKKKTKSNRLDDLVYFFYHFIVQKSIGYVCSAISR
jgi:hypothetical protein